MTSSTTHVTKVSNALIKLKHPTWSQNASIYQINTRQFTDQGTFAAAEAHLPRLKTLGVDILWLMPVQTIGEKNRKGTLGSPYAVKDYYAVNPEFGTPGDLKHFVSEAHKLGFKVILDWVPNHTAWDNVLVEAHPEWYARDWNGEFMPTPWWDWHDIIDLNYDIAEVRDYMTQAMCHWVKEFDIDGYRCDVAGFIPTDFWNKTRKALDAIKPVFMLAEWEARDLHYEAFDMTYGWHWNKTMHEIAQGKADVDALFVYYAWNHKAFPRDAYRMMFVTNHDKNSWEGTEYEQFGDATEAAIVLSVIGEGMPLIYNGQEAGNTKRLEFFERDPIEWRQHDMFTFYQRLLQLKKENTALWNGQSGARMTRVINSVPKQVFSFVRENEKDKIFAVFNFSAEDQKVTLMDGPFVGQYQDFFSSGELNVEKNSVLEMKPWSYWVFTQKK